MSAPTHARLRDLAALRGRVRVFRNRQHAGEVLAELLSDYRGSDAIVLAVPAGGVPVAATLAERLDLSLDVAVVSKITLLWNSEAGYGAVAFDGSVVLNDALVAALALSENEVQRGIAMTREKIARRVAQLRVGPFPDLTGRAIILVDDGLASGFTLRSATGALRWHAPSALVVAVPTAHAEAAEVLARGVDQLRCANLRGGHSFAVADAYERWSDVSEAEAAELLRAARARAAK